MQNITSPAITWRWSQWMVFFAMRALFALLGAFANRHPIEKWAAFAALMSAQMDEWRAGCAGGGVSTGLLREKIIFRGR